ncbi:unnamed protein product [Closterium sp. Naga37s-1]|nr:unnamed protein product [Closterium sp. Naga37s-1]
MSRSRSSSTTDGKRHGRQLQKRAPHGVPGHLALLAARGSTAHITSPEGVRVADRLGHAHFGQPPHGAQPVALRATRVRAAPLAVLPAAGRAPNPLPRNFLPRSVLKRNSLPRDFRGKRAEREEAEGLEEDGAWRLYQQWRGDLMGTGTGGVTGRAGDREQEADGERKKDAEQQQQQQQQQQQGGEWERCGGVGDAASMRSAAGMMADDGPRHAMPPQMKPGNTAGGAAGSGGVRYLMVEVNGGLNQQRTAVRFFLPCSTCPCID